MPLITKPIRGEAHYKYRILAVGERRYDGSLSCPVLDFIADCGDINPDTLERLSALLEFSARNVPPPIETKFKHLTGTDQLFEFKSAGGVRLFCFYDDSRLIICTHGAIKKTRRTRAEELETAHDWKRRYEAAKKAGTLIHETEHE